MQREAAFLQSIPLSGVKNRHEMGAHTPETGYQPAPGEGCFIGSPIYLIQCCDIVSVWPGSKKSRQAQNLHGSKIDTGVATLGNAIRPTEKTSNLRTCRNALSRTAPGSLPLSIRSGRPLQFRELGALSPCSTHLKGNGRLETKVRTERGEEAPASLRKE